MLKQNVLLFGASGAIGSAIFKRLIYESYNVIPVVSTIESKDKFRKAIGKPNFDLGKVMVADVTNNDDILYLRKLAFNAFSRIDYIIFAVGQCQPQGMYDLMHAPPQKPTPSDMKKWEDLLVDSFDAIHTEFSEGEFFPIRFIVIGSTLLRLAHMKAADRPGYFSNIAAFVRAQNMLEQKVGNSRGIDRCNAFFLLKLPAVRDTPFQRRPHNCEPERGGITLHEATNEVLRAMQSKSIRGRTVIVGYREPARVGV